LSFNGEQSADELGLNVYSGARLKSEVFAKRMNMRERFFFEWFQ
jgi:hypothetical protein